MTFSVTKTNRPVAVSLEPDFGPFLYAAIGHERNGMSLSVLSTLARQNLDPWQEAAALAVLPVDLATKRLTSLVAELPGMAGGLDAGRTARRLVLLLPQKTSPTGPRVATAPQSAGSTKSSLVIWMITLGLIMGAQAIAASQKSPTQPVRSQASTARTNPPLKPLLGSGQ